MVSLFHCCSSSSRFVDLRWWFYLFILRNKNTIPQFETFTTAFLVSKSSSKMQIIHQSQRPWHLQTRWMTWDGDQNFEPKNGQLKVQTINWRCSVGKQTFGQKNNEIISKIFHMQQNQCVSTVSSSGLRIAIRAHNAAPKLPRIEIFCTMPRWKQRFFTCPRYESSGMRWLGLRPLAWFMVVSSTGNLNFEQSWAMAWFFAMTSIALFKKKNVNTINVQFPKQSLL